MEEKVQGVSEEKNDSVPATEEKSGKTGTSATQKQPPNVYGRSFVRELFSETIIGIIFWSVFQELIPAFSLNVVKYRRTDYFAVTAVWFSPIFLLVPGLLNFFQSSFGLLLLRVVMVTSLASVQASSPELRLLLLAVGNFSAVLLLCSTWWHKSCHQRSTSFWGTVLGFAGLITLRIWYVSVNPVWTTPTSNSVFIALGILASLDRFSAVEYRMPEFKPHTEFTHSWMLMAGGFGSLLFFTQWLFGDPSVLCRWGIQGYPSTGPHPFPAGFAVFVELMSGILLSTNQKLLTNFLWVWFIGGHMAIGVYYLSGFASFACGLMLGPFVMSAWPEIADRVTSCPPVPTLMLTMAFYSTELYFSIATVVPGIPYGFLFNGRAIWLIAPVVLLIGRCLLKGAFRPPEEAGNTHIAFTNLDGTGAFQMFADAKIFVILILFLGTGGYARQYLTHRVERPSPSNPATVTALIWNSQFMLDNNGMHSHERIADFLRQSDADLIALVQSDSSRLFLGNRDTSMWLSQKLGMFDDFGPATTYHTTGVALLTRYPIVRSEHHVVNGTDGPMVPVLIATVNVSTNLLDVVVAHLPKQRSTFDRRYHLEFITNFTRRSPNPVLFLSSLSSEPTSGDYKRLKTFGKLKDIDPSDEDRFTFSIMYKNLIRLGFARISQASLSEDEAQIAKFHFTSVKSYKDNEHVTTETNNVDKSAVFTKSFGDYLEGTYIGEGHRYQMGTPKYFISNGN